MSEMDNTGVSTKSRNTVRTDLSLLLECLKFQMKCPDSQKQALLTIHLICERREGNVDLLREMGGVTFIYNLSKSNIVRSDVKETALFTLGTLAEANVYCKNYLCRKETFADLAGCLMKEDTPLTQKRVSVYLLSVLVANNKSGQTLSQTTGCLDILLDLFRTTSPVSTEATLRAANATQTYQLWASVSNALCGCVNNPQNVEGQRICIAAFPIIKIWLQQIALPSTEIFQPICSFIAMTVANNSCVQESFSATGCLDTLTLVLVRLASAADTSLCSCQISVTISKTLSACITENSSLASGLAQYGLVSHLFSLLASPHLDPDERLSVLLTLGHCTDASEEHQFQLVQCGGLPLIITLLTEDASEEVRKAATFILQTCKQATMSLGVPGVIMRQWEGENMDPSANMEGFRSSARELLRRIDLLEKRQAKAEDEREDTKPLTLVAKALGQPSLPPTLLLQQKESSITIPTACRQSSTPEHVEAEGDTNIKLQTVRNMIKNKNGSEVKHTCSNLSMQEEKAAPAVVGSVCKGTGGQMSSHLCPLGGGREPHTADNQVFKLPAPVKHSETKEIECTDEEELQGCEMSKVGKIPVEGHSCIRCAGCVLTFDEVTSRTFASLLGSCHHSCDMHMALQEATQRFRTRHCNLLLRREYQDDSVEQKDTDSESVSATEPQRSRGNWSKVCLTPVRKGSGKGKHSLPEHPRKKHSGFTLTPLHRGAKREMLTTYNKTGPGLTPLKRCHLPEDKIMQVHQKLLQLTTTADRPRFGFAAAFDLYLELWRVVESYTGRHRRTRTSRRKRRDFSSEEVNYLLCGVKTFGFSWNSILWSYPFQPGRTNVDLAKKYRRLMKEKGKAQESWS